MVDEQGEEEIIKADCILLHAPSVYDFRDRDDTLFAYLSDSDSVNVTSIYEMYPLGFFSMQQRLRAKGFKTVIINLASIMLMHPEVDVDKLLSRFQAPVFGLDIHWMPHCHGAIEVAKRVKMHHPDALTMFGGISATYFAEELIEYPSVDIVVKGYDTLEPITQILEQVSSGRKEFQHIPNMLFKEKGKVQSTGFSHKPMEDYNDETVDWSFYKDKPYSLLSSPAIMTLPNTGCAMDCGWCGGSRYAYRNIMGVRKTLIQKDHRRIEEELRSLGDAAKRTSIYALQCYSESKSRLHNYIDVASEMDYKSVAFEQFYLPSDDTLHKMSKLRKAQVMLSPESHDPVISKLAGRGTYTMEEMEAWLPKALSLGIEVVVWFFIGMPQQTKQSVMDTVEYCGSLLRKFPGGSVNPLICPMVPFLDPGCKFFEEPEKHGYRIFYRTMEEHRQAMLSPLWHERLNYETEAMTRRDIQDVSYQAIGKLIEIKAESGILPERVARKMLAMIDETTDLLEELERAITSGDGTIPEDLRKTIKIYNGKILAYSSDQIIPAERPFGGRWFDDFTVPESLIEQCKKDMGNVES